MGKTHEVPRREGSRHARTQRKASASRTLELTPEESARLAAFDAVVKMRDEQWAAMTPTEKAEELEAWEQIKKTINDDRAGYRQVFVDE